VKGIAVHPSQQLPITELKVTAVVETIVELGPRTAVGTIENMAVAISKQENRKRTLPTDLSLLGDKEPALFQL
jgi:hypothetical protein